MRGTPLAEAIQRARSVLVTWPDHEETRDAIDAAVALAESDEVTPEALETLGGGWVGEEALAIGLCCALVAPDVRAGLVLAINHSGDSDSTGSIAGNLFGAMHGADALPQDLLEQLEARELIDRVATELAELDHTLR
jgi:ADP-ribosylglycohydrolase